MGKTRKKCAAYMGCFWCFVLFVLLLLVAVLMGGCRSVKYVEVPVVHTDTLIVTNHQKDSIWMHDSIYLHEWMKGDTILVDKVVWHTQYKEKVVRDTIFKSRVDSVGVPYPVTEYVEKPLTWWQKTRMHLGEALLVLLLVAAVYGFIKLRGR